SLEVTCSELRGEVSGYQLFKERIQEMQDAKVKVLSDRVVSMDFELYGEVLRDRVTCSELRGEVSGYQLFKERIEEMHDAQVKVLSDRVA
ncbi:hypothetical protein Tco_0592021, partial [Tanacetum coccineum]